jgi:hypothetical protein
MYLYQGTGVNDLEVLFLLYKKVFSTNAVYSRYYSSYKCGLLHRWLQQVEVE